MAKCKFCGKNIFFGYTAQDNIMPLDDGILPYKLGGQAKLYDQQTRRIVSCTIIDDPDRETADGWGFVPHFATCTGYKEGRRRP